MGYGGWRGWVRRDEFGDKGRFGLRWGLLDILRSWGNGALRKGFE